MSTTRETFFQFNNYEAATGPRPGEKALQKLEEHISRAEPESLRLQAFVDYVEYINTKLLHEMAGGIVESGRMQLVTEIIQQRKSQNKDYKKEHDQIAQLSNAILEEILVMSPLFLMSTIPKRVLVHQAVELKHLKHRMIAAKR